jgi:hypothetical protein
MPVSRAGRWLIRDEGRRTAVSEVYSDDDPTWDEATMDGTVQSRRHGGSAVIDVIGSFPAAAVVANAELLRVLSLDPVTVTCDLSGVTGDLDQGALRELLDTGGLLEHWPGTAVVLVTPRRVEESLLVQYGVGREPAARPTAKIHLDPHPRAVRSARDFVSRTCLDWQLPHVIGSAVLVVGELVTNGLAHAGTTLDVTVSATGGRLLLGVHDGSDQRPQAPAPSSGSTRGHGLHLVAGFSSAWGSLPRADGGKVVWAVLDT